MSPTPSLPDPTDPARPTPLSQRDEDTQHYRQMLYELAEMGMDIARTLHRQATQPAAAADPAPAEAPQPDPTVAFDRIARAIRRTIALARTLTDPAPPSPAAQAGQRRLSARKQVIRAVEDTIQRETQGAEAEALHTEFRERLDAPDLDDDIGHMPIGEVIAMVCRDLGIAHIPGTHPWKRRTPQDVLDLCARAAAGPRTAQPTTPQPTTPQPTTPQPRPGDPRPLAAPPPRARPGTGPPAP